MNGLSVRTAAQGDRAARRLDAVIEAVGAAGLPTQARVLRAVRAELGKLAGRCAREPDAVSAAEIRDAMATLATATEMCAGELKEAGLEDEWPLVKGVAEVLEAICQDAAARAL